MTIQNVETTDILIDYELAKATGLVTAILDGTEVKPTPSECQRSIHDAFIELTEACDALDEALTLESWLQGELETSCID